MQDLKIGNIYETKDYSKFIIYNWNRDINKSTLNKLHKSVVENGWRVEPIIVNEEYGIIDGQHRYTYAKQNGLPIYYIIIKGLTKEDCQTMNAVRTNWVASDYIKFYAVQGNSNYSNLMILDATYTDFNLNIITYATGKALAGGGMTNRIMRGDFKCSKEDFENAVEILDYLSNLTPYIKQIKGRKTQLCQAIIFCYRLKNVDMDRLAKKIAENCNSINPPADMEMALSELERIYNYKIRQENQLYFVTEWKKQK